VIDVTVVVMAKAPVPGRVKTRLCPPCTPVEAAAIAEACLADTLRAVEDCQARRWVLALDGAPGPWLPANATVVAQVAGGLGDRLAAALADVDGPVLAVGMDTPELTPELLDASCRRLLRPGSDAVLGPAADGGYWAIGFREPCPGAFTGVPMSTGETGAHQRARLQALGVSVADLLPLRDVDTFGDALDMAQVTPSSTFARAVARVAARLDGRPRAGTSA
jgi:uncharacterized protein